MKDSTFIKRVILKNYKSIAACDVQLQPLTFLVGRNGSGKSNFLDALRFVADALNYSLEHAIRDRGGINNIRRRSRGHPNHFSISLEFTLPNGTTGYYAFCIRALTKGRYEVQKEQCKLQPDTYFNVNKGKVTQTSVKVAPDAVSDRLYLVNISGLPEFRPVYHAFTQMGFYNFNPDIIRDVQTPGHRKLLAYDGSNITSVYAQLSPKVKQHIEEYLSVIVPGVRGVEVEKFGNKQMLAFKQDVSGDKYPWRFNAYNMSDGTLRALGILVALFQADQDAQKRVPLIGIEDPEVALHPGAIAVLLDGLRDAAYRSQVIVTTHSSDLLDDKHLDVESILAVEADDGNTVIAPVDDASKSVVQDRLFTIGELLRSNQLQPDPADLSAAK